MSPRPRAMMCLPAHIHTSLAPESHWHQHHQEGPSSWLHRSWRVQCPECGLGLAATSLLQHRHMVHSIGLAPFIHPLAIATEYRASFPAWMPHIQCPVDGCTFAPHSQAAMQTHFTLYHPLDSLTEDGPLPCCEQWGMYLTAKALRGGHQTSQIYHKGVMEVIINLRQGNMTSMSKFTRLHTMHHHWAILKRGHW